jgi:hypothetical protein
MSAATRSAGRHECTPRAAFNRVTGFAGIVVWGVLGLCVAVSTAYDIGQWVSAW